MARNETKSILGDLLAASERQTSAVEKQVSLSEIASKVDLNVFKSTKNLIQMAVKVAFEDTLAQESHMLYEINEQMGLTGELSNDFREEIRRANVELVRMGYSYEEIITSMAQLVDDSGKFNLVNHETMDDIGLVAKIYSKDLKTLTSSFKEFESIGVGVKDTVESVREAGRASMELGLNAKKITKEIGEEIQNLNKYGFEKGIRGLERMIQKSTEFRLSMESVYKVADQAFNPEDALDLSANLQVLGGAIGDFNDPIRMMYMATNNVEGFQDAIIETAKGLATYNEESGRFEVTGLNLRRAREMAKALGIEYGDLTKTAIATQERMSGEMALSGIDISDEDKEFLLNLSQMEGGQMKIQLQSQQLQDEFNRNAIALENMTTEEAKRLLEYREDLQELGDDEIVRKQATIVENISRDLRSLIQLTRVNTIDTIDRVMNRYGIDTDEIRKMTNTIVYDKGETNIQYINEGVNNLIDTIGDKLEKNKKSKKDDNINQTTSSVIRHEHQINITSDTPSDEFSRLLAQHKPQLLEIIGDSMRDYDVSTNRNVG